MHRFRKKSDAKRAQVPDILLSGNSWSQQPTLSNQPNNTLETPPSLPPASDFRTSLILPSLSRRFTLLRNSNGEPVSLNDMRSKFAEQRARGAEHQISEEEEDMIVQALGEIQAANIAGSQSFFPPTPNNAAAAFSPDTDGTFAKQQNIPVNDSTRGEIDYPTSIRSGTASLASSPSSIYPRSTPSFTSASRTSTSSRHTSKRNSNNLFGSGRFHDTSYLHSVSKASMGSSRSTTSLTGSDSHGGSVRSTHSTREIEADSGQAFASDADVSGDSIEIQGKASSSRAWPVSPYSPFSALPPRLSKEFTLQQARRTSLALEKVIRGLEEEAEETIMVPRTSSSKAGALNARTQSPKQTETPSAASTPIPWMTDEARVDDRDEDERAPFTGAPSAATAVPPSPSPGPFPPQGSSPTPRLPGYIPGMTRPLTPRDADSDDGATGYSTTPRARSPAQSQHSHHSTQNHSLSFSYARHQTQSSISSEGQSILPPSILRSGRGSVQVLPLRTTSPGIGNRSRGNSVSSPSAPSPVPSPAPEERMKSELLARRPLSPLIGAIVGNGYNSSRPGTPSGVGSWQPSSPLAQVHTAPPTPPNDNDTPRLDVGGHSRHGSFVSGDSTHNDNMHINNGSFSTVGTWASQHPGQPRSGVVNANGALAVHRDPSVSSFDLGPSLESSRPSTVAAKIAARAPTPVHTHNRSPGVNEFGSTQDSILLNRTVSKRTQKRMRSPTPPPHIQRQTQTPPLALHTPSSSSNSSSNVNLNLYPKASPLFSPVLNTSASSLLSAGSSYHSWADENTKKSGWDQLMEYDSQRSAWQDILNSGGVRANEADEPLDTGALGSQEQVLRSITGLTKGDLATVQQRLVTDALLRKDFEAPRSPTRRRRISNSRGSYSAVQSGRESGNISPAPAPIHTTMAEHTPPSPESTSRANALLDSVLNSIQSQSTPTTTSTSSSTLASSDVPSVEPFSSADESSSSKFPSISSSGGESREDDMSILRYKALADALTEGVKSASSSSQEPDPVPSGPIQSPEEDSGEATEVPASHSWRSPPAPVPAPVPTSHSVQLVRDVSKKAAAATAALKNPSLTKIGDDGTLRRRPTKRIDLQQISSPQLVSSSTSVNAIPLTNSTSPQAPSPVSDPRSPLKLSQRFKKLRGTLRSKPSSRDGEDMVPFTLPSAMDSSQTPIHRLPSPTATAPAQTLMVSQRYDAPASATESGRFKVPVPTPPASAGPGLKGFMARFRKPKRDSAKESREHSGHQSPDSLSPISPANQRGNAGAAVSSSVAKPRQSEDQFSVNAGRARSPTPDPATVNQFFNAATQLGLDREALDALLLARTTSTSSHRTTVTQSATAIAASRSNSTAGKVPMSRTREHHSLDRARTPESYKPPARPNATANRHPDGEIVRRTIIFASDNASTSDLSSLARKDSLVSGRPQQSLSTALDHSTGSATREPPVPRLPGGLGRTHSTKPSESSSFYNYSQEQVRPDVQNGSAEESSSVPLEATAAEEEQGQGPALEVLHLSNGQVVWTVLDSLRAAEEEDSESLFRRSMASSRGNDIGDDLEVRFKEHKRWGSKGSIHSQGSHLSRRRQLSPSGGPRPETKLFKTNSNTIGRLIEDLSKNMDSGSFNIMRPATATPSTSTSFHSDTSGPSRQIERDLEALLDVINPRPAS